MLFDLTTLTDEELAQDLEIAQEYLGEVETQFKSEVSLYGDAWPGAAIDVENARLSLERLLAELKRRGEQ